MAGAILSSALLSGGNAYSATAPFNQGYVVQLGNATARYRVDTVDPGNANAVLTYTIIDPGIDYFVGGSLTFADFGGSGFEITIDAVSGSGSGYRNNVH